MRPSVLPLFALLVACGTDPVDPVDTCPACRAQPPVMTLLCNDGPVDEARFAAHFQALDIFDLGGRTGFPDPVIGARFSRKVPLELRAEVLAPLDAYVCVRSLTTHQIVFTRSQAMTPPVASVPLGIFARDNYVLHVRAGTTLVRSIPFASE